MTDKHDVYRNSEGQYSKYKTHIVKVVWLLSWLPRLFHVFLYQLIRPYEGSIMALFRYAIACKLAKKCGENVYIGSNVSIKCIEKFEVGDNVSIHEGCYIDAQGSVSIGSNVSVAHHTSILSFEHTYASLDVPIKYNSIKFLATIIKDDVWIGCGARVLGGCKLGSRSIVGAGSIVRAGEYSSNSIIVGVPAKIIKDVN